MKTLITIFCVGLLLSTVALAEGLPTPDADMEAVVRGNNAFAIELYSQLKSQPGNLIFSPEGISTALAMTYAGARGETATEMAKVLHFTLPPEKLHPAMAKLLIDRNAAHEGYTLKEADALWGQQGCPFLSKFLALVKDNYGAGFNTVDFKDATELARQTINQWVAQQTADRIQNLIAPGVLNAKTRLVLTNAIYFKGDWQAQFKKEDTKVEDFNLSAARTVKVSMMHRSGNFSYYDGGTFQALEISYKNKALSMIVILPKAVNDLPAFEQAVSTEKMQEWLGRLRPISNVVVTLPKFKMESQFGLKTTLADMGVR